MKLDLESYFDVSKLDVWLDVSEFWFEVECRWFDLDLNWRKTPTLIWRSRNEVDFWGSKGALLDLEMTLYFDRMSVGFFSLNFCHIFLIWEASIYKQPNSIWFWIFFQHLLRVNYEFNLVFHLIRAFHMSLFFWHCHMAFFIWCCHVVWFHLLIIHIINWRLIWSWTIKQLWIHRKILMSTIGDLQT